MSNSFFKNTYVSVLIHFVFWLIVLYVLAFLKILEFPSSQNIIFWDAGWYKSIAENGYFVNTDEQSNIAFFPLFPKVWSFLQLSPLLVSCFNILLFILGIYVLVNSFSLKRNEILYLICSPSLFFCFIPYSEALFFLCTCVVLYGLKKQKLFLVFIGLFFSGLCRTTSMLFLPAFFLIELYDFGYIKNYFQIFKRFIVYISVSLLSIVSVAVVQFFDTGKWFGFLTVQKYWGKIWQFPNFPITTWDSSRLLWIDSFALLLSLLSIVLLMYYLKKLYFNSQKIYDKSLLFALSYLTCVGLITLFYTKPELKTTIYSLNRYVLATPFSMVLILELLRNTTLRTKYIYWFFSTVVVISILLGVLKFDPIISGFIAVFVLYGILYILLIT